MKQNKTITLDIEVFKNLSVIDNASALINTLLSNHFKDNRTEEEIIADVKDLIEEKKVIEKQQMKRDKATEKLKEAILNEI